ncbi:MAG: fasciclin domain-containing protein [Bacteroidales bacterium]|nr:fasciclin domain-containing protein [Bacteroidales bacterium]
MILTVAFVAVSCEKEPMIPGDSDILKRGTAEKDNSLGPDVQSIAEIAINAGEFNELVAALSYVDEELEAGLVNIFLNGTDQYTVFAPGDRAFFDLYRDLGIDEITDLPANLVLDVLLYHVTGGRRASNSVVPPTGERTIKTLLGAAFSVNTEGLITAIGNTANIAAADISASNGIIHVIDSVILPKE